MRIALAIYTDNKKASFGFIGEPIKSKVYEEPIENTKRFRIYKKLSLNFFKGEKLFNHYQNRKTSAYIIINKLQGDSFEYSQNMIQLFVSLYPDFNCDDFVEVG